MRGPQPQLRGAAAALTGARAWLQVTYLLGGGSDFSTGGPGKGMHSRLYQRVLVRNTWVSHCAGYSNIFENTGLTGIVASTAHADKGAELPGLICTCAPLATILRRARRSRLHGMAAHATSCRLETVWCRGGWVVLRCAARALDAAAHAGSSSSSRRA